MSPLNYLSENTGVRAGLAITACIGVAMISYQQGQIQASTPKEGQYVTSLVFTATMAGVDAKLNAIKESQDTNLRALRDGQDLRLQLVERELAQLREDVATFNTGKKDAQAAR